MVDLIANKSMRYASRQLTAGDSFEAKPKEAKLLVALKRASFAEDVADEGEVESAEGGVQPPRSRRGRTKAIVEAPAPDETPSVGGITPEGDKAEGEAPHVENVVEGAPEGEVPVEIQGEGAPVIDDQGTEEIAPVTDAPLELQPGDHVRLKSGGPDMTVEGVSTDGFVAASWLNEDGTVSHDRFAADTLDLIHAA